MTAPPLEQFYYFAQVAEHGGYARAARALGIPKSRLSRQVAALEARLNVRLLQRSTRRFAVTEVGQDVLRHAQAMLTEADAAIATIEVARAEPRGIVRVACPVAAAQSMLAPLLPEFLARFPAVRLQIDVSNRRVDMLNERFDVALRVRTQPSGEDGLVMRTFGEVCELLVASPRFLDRAGRPQHPQEVATRDTLSYAPDAERHSWELRGPDGEPANIEIAPRLICHDFIVLRTVVLEGLGIAKLPESVVQADIRTGRLERVLPQWNTPQGTVHLVFPTRRGLLPSVRAFVDFLAERLPRMLDIGTEPLRKDSGVC